MGKKKGQKKAAVAAASNGDAATKKTTTGVTSSHQETLNNMKEKDSEFFKFLAKEDPSMLKFDPTADDDLLTSDEEGEEHQIPDRLDVASDDEDFSLDDDEDDDNSEKVVKVSKKQQVVVDQKMIAHWQKLISTETSSVNGLKEVLQAYHGCLARIDANDDEGDKKNKKKNHKARISGPSHKYKVTTDTIFNSLISFCMQSVPQSLDKILEYESSEMNKKRKLKLPSSCKRWSNIRDTLRVYLDDVLTLTLALVEKQVTRVFVRHMNVMLPYYLSLPKVCKKLARLLVKLWSSSDDESVRVNAFTCLYRLVNLDKKRMHENVLKQCYLSYVVNCKFTSPTILHMINFMQVSFGELCKLDSGTTYRFAFLYIRQLAVHLRKAIVENNKETRKAVYNWQYVHCVALWSRVLSNLHPNTTLQPLIYPLIQVALGVIDLVSTPRFYPLRFHIVRNLVELGACTDVYIPLAPFITAPLLLHDFKKKQMGTSLKPLSFDCILKLSNSQIKEKSYRDSTMDLIYDRLMGFFNSHAHTIAFPEMAVPCVVQLKKFIKECRAPQYSKMMRRIVDKVEENSKYITGERTKVQFAVTDDAMVKAWESSTRNSGDVPFHKHHTQYIKQRQREQLQQIADKSRNVEEKLPQVDRKKFLSAGNKEEDKKEFGDLFDQDEDEEDFDIDFAVNKPKKPKAKKLKRKKEEEDLDGDLDDVSDDDVMEEDDGDDDSEVSMDSDIPLTSDEEDEEEAPPPKKVAKKQVEVKTATKKTKKVKEVKSKKVVANKEDDDVEEEVVGGDGDDVVADFDMSQF